MKAISPVIATVIIVAVAIAISIAVALWITGLTSSFTGVEKLEIINAYATKVNATHWNITVIVKNSGTKPATIDNIFINNKPFSSINSSAVINVTNTASTSSVSQITVGSGITIGIKEGEQIILRFPLTTYDGFSSGQTVSIVIHTASGGQYPATITLP